MTQLKALQLRSDNVVEFLDFIDGGEFVVPSKSLSDYISYVISTKLGINIAMGEYAVYLDSKLTILDEDEWLQLTLPTEIKEVVRILNILHPVLEQGVSILSVFQDLVEIPLISLGSYETGQSIDKLNEYEFGGFKFKLLYKDDKIKAYML